MMIMNDFQSYPLSFLKAPPYLLLCPSNSMISGIAEAKRARPTVRKRTCTKALLKNMF